MITIHKRETVISSILIEIVGRHSSCQADYSKKCLVTETGHRKSFRVFAAITIQVVRLTIIYKPEWLPYEKALTMLNNLPEYSTSWNQLNTDQPPSIDQPQVTASPSGKCF